MGAVIAWKSKVSLEAERGSLRIDFAIMTHSFAKWYLFLWDGLRHNNRAADP